ncbi:phosphoglycolate phosphatase [Hyphomicrobium methylovorum]|uniref:HAD family hydrolase n=1 Tax=Hyphomicrobium methylovorum TaxID=84 RepID=UPI0015E723E7|nr:HAD-IA family hydrolase [Hyphomicrobium methylovorum]MBA2127440.1 phosphoglycolate phosphatase [Hyphomicrobium methylovorum]
MQNPVSQTVVFDLDGTLVDTVADIAAAFDEAISPYSSGTTCPKNAVSMMGDGLGTFFWRAVVDRRLDLPADEAAAAFNKFIALYRRTPVLRSHTYPGIRELLQELKDRDVRMAVCTNKVESIALTILDQLGIRDMFDAVVGHKDDRAKKPDPAPLLEAIALAGGRPDDALMIGDTDADCGAAIAARVPVILVAYGYSSVSVREFCACRHAETVQDLRHNVMEFVTTRTRVYHKASLTF